MICMVFDTCTPFMLHLSKPRRYLYIFGGFDGSSCFDDLYVLDLETRRGRRPGKPQDTYDPMVNQGVGSTQCLGNQQGLDIDLLKITYKDDG